MQELARGKINLGLRVLGKRADGYHQVDMLMQTISFADELELTGQKGFSLTMNDKELPWDERNLAYQAAQALQKATGHSLDGHVHIQKNIFKAAGLAGGSSDAAAVLRGLNNLWQTGLTILELEKIGATLGSDIPFCVRGGTVRATGRGEELTSLPPLPELWLVLAKPVALEVSTAWVYKNYQPEHVGRVDMEALTAACREQKREKIIALLGNDLESVTLPQYPLLEEVKRALSQLGAENVLMSGSGPTIFGVFSQEEIARSVAVKLSKLLPVVAVAARTE